MSTLSSVPQTNQIEIQLENTTESTPQTNNVEPLQDRSRNNLPPDTVDNILNQIEQQPLKTQTSAELEALSPEVNYQKKLSSVKDETDQ